MSDHPLDVIPFWAFFAAACAATFGAIELGVRIGLRRRLGAEPGFDAAIGNSVGAVLGLLAFIIAFTFGFTATRFETRKDLLLDEVNAIARTYRLAGLLREPHRSGVRSLLGEYVDIRVGLAAAEDPAAVLAEAVRRSEEIQDRLSVHAAAVAETETEFNAMFVEALHDMFELQTKRHMNVTRYRVPVAVWAVLAAVSLLAMSLLGFQFGLTGGRSVFAGLALAGSYSAVLLLILNLDRPTRGWLTVDQEPMFALQRRLSADGPGRP